MGVFSKAAVKDTRMDGSESDHWYSNISSHVVVHVTVCNVHCLKFKESNLAPP